MNWDRLKTKLEQILNVPMRVQKMSDSEWHSYIADSSRGEPDAVISVDAGDSILFYLGRDGAAVYALKAEYALLTASERQLIELSVEGFRCLEKKPPVYPRSEEESRASALRDWIGQQLDAGFEHKEMPDSFAAYSSLYSAKVPILLNGDYSDDRKVTYRDLKKLLESFFEAEIILVPLHDKEWMILGSETLLTESGAEDKSDDEETVEEALASICSGLHEMMESEWVGECHLAISYPIVPAKSLLASVIQLRETISLGRTYHVGKTIHLPWEMHLDRLMNRIPASGKAAFIDHIFKQKEHLLDAEMMQTLDYFFDLDCNVSDTAKKLYIHRNTLLYRLDKFKHETGLDVRSFNDAVLVKLALLLYKVTKRK